MLNDILLFVDRSELEFIKNEVVEAVTDDVVDAVCRDREWLIMLAAKLIKACEENDNTTNAIQKSVEVTKES